MLAGDRSGRGKLRFSGEQDLWFLHQILTQSFEDMTEGEARDAAMITAHGRMLGYLEAVRTRDAVLAHFEPELRDTLPDAIRRYVFATRVEIDDVSDDMGLVLVVGAEWEGAAAEAASSAAGAANGDDIVLHPTQALGEAAGYLWVERGSVEATIAALIEAGATAATEDELEDIRIRNGVPRWGREMTEKSLPQESGADTRAVHYDKGCYVGQEAMAKIHFRGQVGRKLVRLEGDDLQPGQDVVAAGERMGAVTSAGSGSALAIVKRSLEQGMLAEAAGRTVKVVDV